MAVALLWVLGLVACSEDPVDAPTTAEFKQERERLKAKAAQAKKQQKGKQVAKAAKQPLGAKGEDDETQFAGVSETYIYNPKDKRDPFRIYSPDTGQQEGPRGPLEQFELEQLDVVAVVWETNRPRALVQDPSGTSYVVREGSRVGKNQGLVIHIGDNLVLVKETYVDFAGDQSTKDVELRVRESQGG